MALRDERRKPNADSSNLVVARSEKDVSRAESEKLSVGGSVWDHHGRCGGPRK